MAKHRKRDQSEACIAAADADKSEPPPDTPCSKEVMTPEHGSRTGTR